MMHELDQKIEEKIAEVGWYAIGVYPTADDPPEAYSFLYTIGLTETWSHPELIVCGLSHDLAYSVIAGVAHGVSEGESYAREGEYGNVLEGYKVEVRRVADRKREHLAVAWRYYGGGSFEARQLVWPDAAHRFPWEPSYGYPPTLQPVLT